MERWRSINNMDRQHISKMEIQQRYSVGGWWHDEHDRIQFLTGKLHLRKSGFAFCRDYERFLEKRQKNGIMLSKELNALLQMYSE